MLSNCNHNSIKSLLTLLLTVITHRIISYDTLHCVKNVHIRTEYGPEKLRIRTLFTQCYAFEANFSFRFLRIAIY